jgi:hypothetical protein
MCFAYEKSKVKDCTAPLCPLYPYRLGKNPGKKGGKGKTPAEMKALSIKSLQKLREKQAEKQQRK